MFFFGPSSNVAQRNSNFPKNGLTQPEKKGVQNASQEECNHLAKVLEFNSQYFPS